ncbi:MAG: HD domain-containing protein [Deltaproteobacteria bacterium]|jgi:putative hydrolase of HD superfamily|nr:HD domain-containing protein [Deltaproteobacteria bacterium]
MSECDATKNIQDRGRLQRIVDFFHEAGMLRFTPRTGYQFLGSGKENVAEHSFRTALIGWALARLAGADAERTALICLFHDLPEARTGDFNYVNRIYNTTRPRRALEDAVFGTGLAEEALSYWDELESNASLEAKLARDADVLDLLLNLKRELDLGNKSAAEWLNGARARLCTPVGQELAQIIVETDHNAWWFQGPDASWWKGRGE